MIKQGDVTLDVRSELLKNFGKLADTSISMMTRQHSIDRISELLKGYPINEETFKTFDIESRIEKNQDETEVLVVTIPKEFLPIDLQESKEAVEVGFTIKKKLNI